MENNQINNEEYYTIDVIHILRTLWYKAWILALVGILSAFAGFAIANYGIEPEYSSSILLYVNNSSINFGSTNFSISASDISASQSLVKTYTELLKNRTTLERVIEKSGVGYTYKELYGMVQAGSSNETEIMYVKVTCHDPYEASHIANCIAEVLPARITEIIDGASMEVVDSAIPVIQKVSPSITKYTAVGMMLGVIVAGAIIAVIAIMDDTIRDEEYILKTYDYPILAKVPNLLGDTSRKRGYYNSNYAYYYKHTDSPAK